MSDIHDSMIEHEKEADRLHCEHDPVYENVLLMSNPPQQRWICRKCGQRGTKTLGPLPKMTDEYSELIRKFGETHEGTSAQ